jgi:IS30 family transposase
VSPSTDGKRYTHLSAEERAVLQVGLSQGLSLRAIGAQLGRSHSSLSREVRRVLADKGASEDSAYRAKAGGEQYADARRRCVRGRKLAEGTELRETVQDLLNEGWSPEQIASRLKAQADGKASAQTVSHETIYATLCRKPRGKKPAPPR